MKLFLLRFKMHSFKEAIFYFLLEHLHGHNLAMLCKSLLNPNTPVSLSFGFAQRLFLKAGLCF